MVAIDTDSAGAALAGLEIGAAMTELHRAIVALHARHGRIVACTGRTQGTASECVAALSNLGCLVYRGQESIDSMAYLARQVAQDGRSVLFASADTRTADFLDDGQSPRHWLDGPFGARRIYTYAQWVAASGRKCASLAREACEAEIEVVEAEANLRNHMWWLASRGAVRVFEPGLWKLLERVAQS